ncbi:hypothetical protein BZA70DRAFT_265979 [Myxozyma melibiosi]|uniref:Sugar phosphate phosphatase n=1 Tax=Myxozyma melibiosi TaxID=54550 RepID=A0ABR1F9M4_9ASCO
MSAPVACPVAPYCNDDTDSFAYTSARARWPTILDGVIADVKQTVSEKGVAEDGLIAKLEKVKQELLGLVELVIRPLEDDGGEDIALYNAELKRQTGAVPMTYANGPWLYTECYLYRKIYSCFKTSKGWEEYDFFARQKLDAFKSSESAVVELAIRYKALSAQLHGDVSKASLEVLFREFIDISLWGNATDLSLLTTLSLDQLQSLQGAAARQKSEKNILVNDVGKAWAAVSDTTKYGRVDIVLDNAGFEFYTDMIFALFLLDSGLAETIVFHPKSIPWFVSDVMPVDLGVLVSSLSDPAFFTKNREELDYLSSQIMKYSSDGKIIMRQSPFWTTSLAFWELREGGLGGGHEVWDDLRASKLVIFKGDLNHRKLVYDAKWPRTTPWATAIGPLASAKRTLFSLRTCKADVVVGLAEGKEEELEKFWIESGKSEKDTGRPGIGWAWSGKWAVMPFTDGKE